MRLPRRIFLNVVIFVSSFLVVSYHLSSIVPQDGTVHNVLYRYLFRTIFLFRPRAPAAPCSRSFLLSYCSTPPLKRKIKFSLQTVPFVPTPAAFFLAAGGVVIRRTFSAGAGQRGLESAAQFSTGCIVIGGTVCRAASFIQVVILHTIPGSRRWNPPHSLRRAGLLSAAQFRCGVHRGAKKMVVIGRTIRTFFCGRQVVIHSTICAVGKIRLLLSAAHFGISSAFQTCPDRVVIQRTFPEVWLLSGAQFPNCRILAAVVIDGTFLKKINRTAHSRYCYSRHNSFFPGQSGCYPAHNSQKSVFLRRVLPWVVSLRTVCPAGAGVVIDGTIQGFFSTGCYSAHISPRQDFSIRPVGMLRTFLTFPFSRPGVVILDTF